jgi:NAD(P)-dependent dehydrogenase (short-subunit alcohol dehydrogenase family)
MAAESVSGPVALVIGADVGSGREMARRLAGVGYGVYLGARSGERGRPAAAIADVQPLDVASDESVRHADQAASPTGDQERPLTRTGGGSL